MKYSRDYRSLFVSQLHAAYRVLARDLEAAVPDVDGAEGHMLSYTLRYGPCTVGTLSEVFGVKGATLTGQLDKLERRGLLKRQPNPADRRSFLVAVTPKGERLMRRIGEHVIKLEAGVRERVSDRDYQGFLKVIDAIREVRTAGQGATG